MRKAMLTFALGAGLMLPIGARADIVFTDGTFNLGNYSQTAPFTIDASNVVMQCASCGNPGQALQDTITVPGANGTYAQGFTNLTFSYDPSTQGPLGSVAASIDKNATLNFEVSGFGNSFRPLIEQNGNFYLAIIQGAPLVFGPGGGSTGYLHFAQSGLTAGDFTLYDFSTNTFGVGTPDFSGNTLLFGLAQITTLTGSGPGTDTVQFDNLSIVLSTPEPASVALLALPVLAVFARRRRHARA